MANERPNVVKMKGNPVTLLGNEVKVGDKAPDFTALAGLGAPVGLGDMKDKVKVFNVVVSVDTPVCDVQTKRFNKEAAGLGDGVEIVTLSMDLPFALKRYCAAEGIDRVKTLSDYQNASFGEAYGVLIKENRLLARSIFVVDKNDKVRHAEIVGEITQEPNYEAALKAVRESL
ncbi:MAG: thiol peroxidase [Candidatus Dadabacteria bacterium]|nr:thiol peroxidase [Candidatus Dadabacteria bacterium]HSC34485.1 thiol peroxidase [Thermodesulfobacteriota bacterium]